MNKKTVLIFLASLLAAVLVGCEGLEAVQSTPPAETPPEVTQPPTQETPEVTQPPTEETPEVTQPPTEETPEVTQPPTEETPEVTQPPTEETPEVTQPPTEETPEVPPTQPPTAPPTQPPTAPPTQTPTAPPTQTPTAPPTQTPTAPPTQTPTAPPTQTPTAPPTEPPTQTPTAPPAPPPSGNTAVPYPSAPGTAVEEYAGAVLDYSNVKDGYVMVKWTGDATKIAIQVTGPNNPEKYTYYPRTDGNYEILPLSDGEGTYHFLLCKSAGTKYIQLLAKSITVKFSSSLAPFLRPSQYVNYTSGSEAVKKGQELTAGSGSTLGKVQAVYNWVVTNVSYDYDKARTVQSGYIPDVDNILRTKKGICFDYSALMAAMLRSQGIPVKMVFGYTSTGEYHAWLNVWSEESGWMDSVIYFDGNTWKLMDPTFASSGKQSKSIMEYIGNTANYKVRFTY